MKNDKIKEAIKTVKGIVKRLKECQNFHRSLKYMDEKEKKNDKLLTAELQALQILMDSTLYKIDEKKVRKVIKRIDFDKNIDIVVGAKKAWFSLSGLNKITKAIVQGDINGLSK